MDPLDFTITDVSKRPLAEIGLSADSRIRISALISPEVIGALRAHRTSRRISDANTETMVGDLLAEILSKYTPHLPLAKGLETNATKAVRWALAEAAASSKNPLTRAELHFNAKVSVPTVALAVKALVRMELVEPVLARWAARPVDAFKLTMRGLKISAEDHPDAQVRFILGGMLPDELDPFRAKSAPEPEEPSEAAEPEVADWRAAIARAVKASEPQEE